MTDNTSVMVLGSEGQLGLDISQKSKKIRSNNKYLSRSECDITSPESILQSIHQHNPSLILNFTAYTAVDKAESEPEKAFAVNAEGCRHLAEICAEKRIKLIHISTDYVFDGKSNLAYKETDETNPLGMYGASKLAGEKEIIQSGVKGAILRTSWLYSAFRTNFVKTILKKSQEVKELRVVDDQIGTPTWTSDLVDIIYKLTQDESFGESLQIYHFSNEGVASWYDFACAIQEYAGFTAKITPVPTSAYPTACKRPVFTVLSKEKIKNDLGIIVPHWRESLKKCLELMRETAPEKS